MVPTVTSTSVTESPSKTPKIPLSQEILREIRNFVGGATFGSKFSRTELAKSAIFLLKTLPAAREAILEYLCTIFDEAVSLYTHNLELEAGNVSAGSNSTGPLTTSETEDIIIQDVQDILSRFISSNPEAWSPIVSSWSLDLLGQLSSKYSDSRGIPHASSLNEVLQLWMSCRPTRTLVDLSTQCISTLIGSNPDTCIDALLETSVQHSPHFDWVVAHIGSCFPTTIITRVLACGLKDFCSHEDQDIGTAILSTPSKRVPKMASVVGILGHLAGQHSEDIHKALLSLFEDSFVPHPTVQHLATVPFLLQLSSMSNMLRRVITMDFVKALTPKILNELYAQIPKWHQLTAQNPEDLANLVVHLVLQSEEGGWPIINFLLNTAAPSGTPLCLPQVSQVCGRILDFLLLQIHYLVNTKSGNFQVEVPILLTLTQNIPQLCHHLLGDEDNLQRAHWVSKLLSSLAMYSKECIAVNILAHLLVSAIKPFQLTYLSHLMTVIEPTASHLLSEMTISQIMTQSLGRGKHCSEQFLKNVWCVVQWEAEGLGGFSMTRLRFTDCLSRFLQPLADQLTHPSIEAACCTMGVLARIPIPDSLSMTVLTSLATSTVTFFIEVIARMELSSKIAEIPVCCKFVSKLCKHTSAQNMTLRFLLEAVLDVNNCHYFNGKTSNECAANTINNSASINETVSLLEENQKHAVSNTLPQSHSTVFHAGIIGNGLRPQCNTSTRPQDEILVNTQLLLEMIKSACVPCRRLADEKLSVGPVPTIQGMTTVALLLVELVSSDVMFNGLPWPEEEFTKVTIERDLYIKRMFDFNPFLWDLLYLVAHCRPALCYCSVLLRALAATMMSFWAASQAKMTLECRKHLNLTCRLIDVMAIGQLLPPPLSLISEIFPKISPYEAHILLGDVWKYMKDNVPSPVAFVTSDPQSYPWRDFGRICDQKYTTRLHCILQSNMAKFGPLFIRFFSADDKM